MNKFFGSPSGGERDLHEHGAVPPHPDPLTQVLDGMQLRCLIPSAHEMTAPWGVQFGGLKASPRNQAGPDHRPAMHGEIVAVLRGSCCLEMPLHEVKLSLTAGDVVLVARPDPFILRDHWDSPVRTVQELKISPQRQKRSGLRYGGGGAPASLLTGPFYFEDA